MEKWKDIYGYTGYYQISNHGNIRNVQTGRILIPWDDQRGYFVVGLFKNKIETRFKIHRLVAKYFVANPHKKPQVNHKDGNKKNNHYRNLKWCTNRENQLHAIKIGLVAKRYTLKELFTFQGKFKSQSVKSFLKKLEVCSILKT